MRETKITPRAVENVRKYVRTHGACTKSELVRNLKPVALLLGQPGFNAETKAHDVRTACHELARQAIAYLWLEGDLWGPFSVYIGGKFLHYWIYPSVKYRGRHPFAVRDLAKAQYPEVWKNFIKAPKPDPLRVSSYNAKLLNVMDQYGPVSVKTLVDDQGTTAVTMGKRLHWLMKKGWVYVQMTEERAGRGRRANLWRTNPEWREHASKKYSSQEELDKIWKPPGEPTHYGTDYIVVDLGA